jgi:GMP synthase (glutamine-hydrolysing)
MGASRKTAVALRHVAFEDLGSLEPCLRDEGYAIEYLEAGWDPIDRAARDADLLVVLGGPIGAYEAEAYPFLRDEMALLEARLAAGRPTLGICLGAQLIAQALAARVRPAPAKEIGWSAVQLTSAGRRSPLAALEKAAVLHWHGDMFEMPAAAERLASTPACENQAFRLGANVLALQFHPEVCARALERWYIGHAAELAQARVSPTRLRAEAARHDALLQRSARELWARWLRSLD